MTALADGHVWVEVTSHRARSRLSSVVSTERSYGVWPESGWPYGEYYQVPAEVAATLNIPGVKVRKRAPRGRIFERWHS